MSIQECHSLLDRVLSDIDNAVKRVKAGKSKQVSKSDEIDFLKSIAYSWFHSWRESLVHNGCLDIDEIDVHFGTILEATAKKANRSTYLNAFKNCRKRIASLRREVVEKACNSGLNSEIEVVPDFSVIVSDQQMQSILVQRWYECRKCVDAEAFLASTVMMGGLLETLFVACANRLSDKSVLFKAKTTPRDSKTQKPLPLQQWTLRPYIDVAHELGWISRSGKDIAEVLRDYRNYVHPEKQRSHGITLSIHDAQMFWDVTKNILNQLLSRFGGK